jgi:uncharacterized protein with PIN domain
MILVKPLHTVSDGLAVAELSVLFRTIDEMPCISCNGTVVDVQTPRSLEHALGEIPPVSHDYDCDSCGRVYTAVEVSERKHVLLLQRIAKDKEEKDRERKI